MKLNRHVLKTSLMSTMALNEAKKECEYRNELACTGLQPETHDDHNGNNWVNGSHQTIKAHLASIHAIKHLQNLVFIIINPPQRCKTIIPR